MKFRTKLILSFLSITFVSMTFGLFIVYTNTNNLLLDQVKDQSISIAASTAATINPEILKMALAQNDECSPEYLLIQEHLKKIRNANRRTSHGVYVKYMYTVMRSKTNPQKLLFGIDTEENPIEFSHLKEPYLEPDALLILEHGTEYYSPKGFNRDPWGIWLNGFAPIFDKEGDLIANVGVDISATDVQRELDRVLLFGVWASIGSMVLALLLALFLSRQVSIPLSSLCTCVKEIGVGHLEARAGLKGKDEFNELAKVINSMANGLQERERLKMNFSRYVSQHIMEKILKSEDPMKLEGERKKVTILFSDIREFSLFVEKLPPEVVVTILNDFFDKMLTIIFKNYGTLDKFLGNGIMVEFGAPIDDPLQEKHAIMTALEMQKELGLLCDKWKREGKPVIEIGIGIHTGLAVLGNIGTEQRMEYTAIGDTVNVAARLEQATKTLNVPIIASETTFQNEKKYFEYKNLGSIALPGRKEGIVAYAIYPSLKET